MVDAVRRAGEAGALFACDLEDLRQRSPDEGPEVGPGGPVSDCSGRLGLGLTQMDFVGHGQLLACSIDSRREMA